MQISYLYIFFIAFPPIFTVMLTIYKDSFSFDPLILLLSERHNLYEMRRPEIWRHFVNYPGVKDVTFK